MQLRPICLCAVFILFHGAAGVCLPLRNMPVPVARQSNPDTSGETNLAEYTGISVSDETMVVGNLLASAAYVYERNRLGANEWGLAKALAPPADVYRFGWSVAIDENLIVVGAPDVATWQGRAYVFGRHAGGTNNWGLLQTLSASDPVEQDSFGFGVAIAGDTIAVGAPFKSNHSGAVYLFENPLGTGWSQTKKLTAPGSLQIGLAVDFGDDEIAIGSNNRIYVRRRDAGGAGSWGTVATLDSPLGNGIRFGHRFALEASLLVAGAPDHGADYPGAAVLYQKDRSGTWASAVTLSSPQPKTNGQFGSGVAVSRGCAWIGERNSTAASSSKVYGFCPRADQPGTWELFGSLDDGELKGTAENQFGLALAADESRLAVVDSSQSVLVYYHDPLDQRRLRPPWLYGPPAGTAIAADGGLVVVGAAELGTAGYGAAYVYRREGGFEWQLEKELRPGVEEGVVDGFGSQAALDANTIVVSTEHPFDDRTYVFERHVGGVRNWAKVKVIPFAGDDLALSAGRLVVGRRNDGEARVFEKHFGGSNAWGQAQIIAPNVTSFGAATALSPDRLVVGAPAADLDQDGLADGGVFVYRHAGDASGWVPEATLAVDDRYQFGLAVAVSSDGTRIVTSDYDGVAYVFVREAGATAWTLEAELPYPGSNPGRFNTAVATEGELVLVSSPSESAYGCCSSTGSIWAFARDAGGQWQAVTELRAFDGRTLDRLGSKALAIGDGAVFAGAPSANRLHSQVLRVGGAYAWAWPPALGGVVGRWPLDEGSGSIARDASGAGRDGALDGPQWAAGVSGSALRFDGLDDRLLFGTGPALDGKVDFTVAARVKTESEAAAIFIQQRNGGFNGEYLFGMNQGGFPFFALYGDGNYQYDFAAAESIADGEWHHVAATREGSEGRIYVDGEVVAAASGTPRSLDRSIEVAAGADVRDNYRYFDGVLDELIVLEGAVSQEDVILLQTFWNLDGGGTTPLFVDGFESGDLSRWSAASP